ncbi:hypothetical protein BH09ACT8_BH09ACT8_59090 [soil metagenome]
MTTEIYTRSAGAAVLNVDSKQRIITMIAVPWNQRAAVEYQGAVWNEIFERGAFDGIDANTRSIRVNRDHNKTRTMGKIIKLQPRDPRGLITEVRIAPTPLGDETLALADEDMLSASVGFAVPRGGAVVEVRTKTRRIRRAVLDHLSLVESPAYEGASVLAVRSANMTVSDYLNDPIMQWAARRTQGPAPAMLRMHQR